MENNTTDMDLEIPQKPMISRIKNDGVHWRDAHLEFTKGKVETISEEEVNEDTSWEIVSFDTIRENIAKHMLQHEKVVIDKSLKDAYIEETSSKWDKFYSHNATNFFKDRNYLGREFEELNENGFKSPDGGNIKVLEVGSGVGNTVFPLLSTNPEKYFYAFDCSSKAIELLKSHERYDESRIKAFVCDITREDIPESIIPDNSIDIVTSIFFLSALAREQMDDVLKKIYRVLKPGGVILFRDYGVYDLTQMRFFAKKNAKLDENFYRRSDGTFTYFFSLESIEQLFTSCGFEVIENKYETRVINNRKRKIKMYRVWIQCRFRKPMQNED